MLPCRRGKARVGAQLVDRSLDVAEIRHADIARALGPLALFRDGRHRKGYGGPVVAKRLRARIERVLDFAAVRGFRDHILRHAASEAYRTFPLCRILQGPRRGLRA